MLIDMHVHESKYSKDSFISMEEAVERAKKIGLNGICITDHESSDIFDEAHEYSKKTGFLVLVGAEILTFEGDLLVFGLKDIPKHKIHAGELLNLVAKDNGIAISAHPFRNNNRGLGNHINEVSKILSGVEAFNGSTELHQNIYAYNLASKLNLPSTGSSDAHVIDRIGKYATVFQGSVRDERDLIEAVKSGKIYPAMLQGDKYFSIGNDFNRAAV